MLKEKKADAVLSAGSTGATLIGSISVLGKIKGVIRPTIASVIPSSEKEVILVDSGANLEVKPKILYQFAVMVLEMFYTVNDYWCSIFVIIL